MQGEKGSLLELQRYHRGHHPGGGGATTSPRVTPPRGESELGTLNEETASGDEEETLTSGSPTAESDLKALRALQAKLFLATAPPANVNRSRGGRRHTLANLGR